MLTDAELSEMRGVAETALPGTAIIQSRVRVSDGGGGGSVTWSSAGTVACRIAPLTGREGEIGDRVTAEADSIVTLPAETTVAPSSRLLIGGGTFNVQHVRTRSWDVTTRVEVQEQT